MPQFPRREPDIIVLCNSMIEGYTNNPGVFPKSDLAALQAKKTAYDTAHQDHLEKRTQSLLATEVKDQKLAELEVVMGHELKQSEVDTAAAPDQLGLIGWGPKAPAHPSQPPGQPRNLDPIIQGATMLHLDWKIPARGSGGPVRTYLVQRRDQSAPGGAFGEWKQVGIALEPEITLTDQPRGQQLEYRVIGVNVGGQSAPSNSVPVVL